MDTRQFEGRKREDIQLPLALDAAHQASGLMRTGRHWGRIRVALFRTGSASRAALSAEKEEAWTENAI